MEENSNSNTNSKLPPPPPQKLFFLADLNANPPDSDDPDPPPPVPTREANYEENQKSNNVVPIIVPSKEEEVVEEPAATTVVEEPAKKLKKSRSRSGKSEPSPDHPDADHSAIPPPPPPPSSRDDKITTLKTGLVHVARKMPKNAHAHFMLGLMHQRLGQYQKAVLAYEKAEELLLNCEAEVARPELLSLAQVHHAQCVLLETVGDNISLDKELEGEKLEETLSRLKESMQMDIRQAAVWNTLGLILLKSGCLQSAVAVLSLLLALDPNNSDCLANLGIAYLQSGNVGLSGKCFQDLILKDLNHPAALVNYAAFLLHKFGSVVAGVGANASEGASTDQNQAVNVAKECLLTALMADPKAGHAWSNLADAYYMAGDHRSSGKCLEKATKLEPNCMSTRYAVAMNRIKDAERSQDLNEQLSWAGNEMASIIREGDLVPIEMPIGWSGLGMVHKAQYEIAAAFEAEENKLMEVEELASCSLKQAMAEDPDDGTHWHQLGLHSLRSRQFETAQKHLKAAVARLKEFSYGWTNLGVSLQLSDATSAQAEAVYKHALTLATPDQAHTIFCNLGNLYRQHKQYERAKAMFTKALDLKPGYAVAFNNLGLVFIAEGQFEEAKFCFEKALQSDPLLDAAKSNMIKAMSLSRLCAGLSSFLVQD